MNKLFGGIEIAEQKGLTSMPQDAASAWIAVEGAIVGCGYKPLIYVGKQITKGTTFHFIAEQTLILAEPQRHIVKIAVNEFNQKNESGELETVYKIVPHSIEIIY